MVPLGSPLHHFWLTALKIANCKCDWGRTQRFSFLSFCILVHSSFPDWDIHWEPDGGLQLPFGGTNLPLPCSRIGNWCFCILSWILATAVQNQFASFAFWSLVQTSISVVFGTFRMFEVLFLFHHTIFFSGAGISVAAGIPDFRTPGTGLYSRLEKYNLPAPSAIFDLEYFPAHPEPFYSLAKELWPGNYSPTLGSPLLP